MRTLYCYVDESGQHTTAHADKESVFVVAVATFEDTRDALAEVCTQYERDSGKRQRKWRAADHEAKMTYARMIFADKRFVGTLSYHVIRGPGKIDFDESTIEGIARTVELRGADDEYTAELHIDGLTATKRAEYSVELRRRGFRIRRVHLTRDDHDPLIRLADAVAGLAREAEEGEEESRALIDFATGRAVVTVV